MIGRRTATCSRPPSAAWASPGVILWAEIAAHADRLGHDRQEALPFGSLDDFLTARARKRGEPRIHRRLGRLLSARGRASPACSSAAIGAVRAGFAPMRIAGPACPSMRPRSSSTGSPLRPSTAPIGPGTAVPRSAFASTTSLSFIRSTASAAGTGSTAGRGFFQYQCVVPYAEAGAIAAIVRRIARSGQGSFLSVLKTFGERPSPGLLSFPRPGVTLALDLPNRGEHTLALLHASTRIVREAGGRLYPAKDGRMPPQTFRAGYPQLDRFLPQIDPSMQSDFGRRVLA